MSLTLQKLEHPLMGGKPLFWLVILTILSLGLQRANALNSNQISVTNKSGTNFILDSNQPASGARAAYVAYEIKNISNLVLTGVSAKLSGFATGFALAGGQAATQAIGTLAPGTSVTLFWFVTYPHTSFSASTNLVITVSDSNSGTVSSSLNYRNRSSISSSAGGSLVSRTVGVGLVTGQTTYVDVKYALENGNISSGGFAYFQPAGNPDFDAACFKLTRTEVITSTVPSFVPVGTLNTLYFTTGSSTGGGSKEVTIRYTFQYACTSIATVMKPYSGNRSGSNYKHVNNYGSVLVNVPTDFPLLSPCQIGSFDDFALKQEDIGFEKTGDNWSVSWGDYNNDGFPDLFFTTHDAAQPNALYVNNRDASFSKVDVAPFNQDLAPSQSSSWGDYDNDGDLDLYVANNIGHENFLYRNEGSGIFTKILKDPIVSDNGYSHGTSWVDYDNDGFLDMFVATYWETEVNLLYRNNGDGTFNKITDNILVNEAARSVSGAWCDYDNDGLQDLFISNTGGQNNSLYHNVGGGQFERITTGDIVNDGGSSVGASWGDYNNDGFIDLFVANAGNEPCFLYKNNGNGSFTKVTDGAIVTDKGDAHGSAWADWDNDGDLDLFVARDGRNNSLYRNDGGDVFTPLDNAATKDGGPSFGCAWADFDRDGDLDLAVANRDGFGNFFYRNGMGDCNNWTSLKLEGTVSNKSAIGAKVIVTAVINGQTVTQTREVTGQSGGGIGGQNELVLNLGLGNATIVNSIIVKWPSGYRQTLVNQPINERLTIIEDNATEVTGRVYWEEGINCRSGLPTQPTSSLAASFRTAQSGNWSSPATWVGGYVPSYSNISNLSISIEHDVTIPNGNIYMTGNNSTIWVTNAKLKMTKGNLTLNQGAVKLLGATLEMNNGNFDIVGANARFEAIKSSVTIRGHHTTIGKERWEDACLQLSGSFNNAGPDTLKNVKMIVEGNFQNYQAAGIGRMVVENAKIHVTDGDFQNIFPATVKGSGLTLWLDDGNLQNWSTWTAGITNYCTPGWALPVGVLGYLPVAKDCANIAEQFVSDPCVVVIAAPGNRVGIPYAKVVFQPGDYTVFADENGYYSAYLPVGDYTAQEQPGSNFTPACPNSSGTRTVTVSSPGQVYSNVDFGNAPIDLRTDLFTEVVTTAHRIGAEDLLIVRFKNLGLTPSENTILEVTLPDEIEVVSTSLPVLPAKSQSLSFDLGTLASNASGNLFISYTVGLSTPVGQELLVASSISGSSPDLDLSNNQSLDKSMAVASFDPNDIAVSPARFVKKDEWLRYKIRFQNVGNHVASQIRVEDELPAGVDMSTLEMGAVSHLYKLQVVGRKLQWTFPNINLPDSLSNEPQSHGYITFRIKPSADKAIGERMPNRAAIYFDNLEPVITNTVENVLTEEILKQTRAAAIPLQLFPNPSGGRVVVQSYDLSLEPEAFFVEISVFDHFGKQVYRDTDVSDQRSEFYLHQLTDGHYVVKALDSKGRAYFGKLVLMKN